MFNVPGTTVLMNLWVYPALFLFTCGGILSSPLLVAYFKLTTTWDVPRIVRHLIWIYGRGWLLIIHPFVDFERTGLSAEQIPKKCVFVINHLSFFDTYFMGALPDSDVTFAVRSWPFKMFWYRLFMRLARYLEVENASWDETMLQGKEVLNQGGAVLFFPEGHRSRDGKLQRFYSGAFKMAVASGCPIVPLCITGTDTLLPPERLYLKPSTVRLHILPAVSSENYAEVGGHRRLGKDVKKQMAQVIESLNVGDFGGATE